MSENEKKIGLPRPPLYTDDYITMAEALTFMMESFGELILALMYYTADGTMPEKLSPELKVMFSIYQKKIDFAREKYEQTCMRNARNGKNGGRPRKTAAADGPGDAPASARAEPPETAGAARKIRMPPTRTQLTRLIQREQAEGLISEKCDPAEFFEWAETLKWRINGEPARSVGDFLAYAEAKYPKGGASASIPTPIRLELIYGIIFKELHGLRDDKGSTGALAAAIDFLKAYDGGWSFHGQSFTDGQWKEALAAFMEDLILISNKTI